MKIEVKQLMKHKPSLKVNNEKHQQDR